jgi:ABC-2 type transport system ATP-binding protein
MADRNAGKLSRGMLQRVALAQALINDPDLLVLDEPTSALDPLGRVAVRELLQQAKAAGKTVFLSSHLLSEIESVCDRVGIIHRGRLRRIGKTHELLESSAQTEIIARGVPAGRLPTATAQNGLVRVLVPSAKQRETIEQVWSAGGEVVRVNPLRRSLEDIFLEIVGEKPGGGIS